MHLNVLANVPIGYLALQLVNLELLESFEGRIVDVELSQRLGLDVGVEATRSLSSTRWLIR